MAQRTSNPQGSTERVRAFRERQRLERAEQEQRRRELADRASRRQEDIHLELCARNRQERDLDTCYRICRQAVLLSLGLCCSYHHDRSKLSQDWPFNRPEWWNPPPGMLEDMQHVQSKNGGVVPRSYWCRPTTPNGPMYFNDRRLNDRYECVPEHDPDCRANQFLAEYDPDIDTWPWRKDRH
jgi:hypothetical protein